MKKRILAITAALVLFAAYVSTAAAQTTTTPADPPIIADDDPIADYEDTGGGTGGTGGTTPDLDPNDKCTDWGYNSTTSNCSLKTKLTCPLNSAKFYCATFSVISCTGCQTCDEDKGEFGINACPNPCGSNTYKSCRTLLDPCDKYEDLPCPGGCDKWYPGCVNKKCMKCKEVPYQ